MLNFLCNVCVLCLLNQINLEFACHRLLVGHILDYLFIFKTIYCTCVKDKDNLLTENLVHYIDVRYINSSTKSRL